MENRLREEKPYEYYQNAGNGANNEPSSSVGNNIHVSENDETFRDPKYDIIVGPDIDNELWGVPVVLMHMSVATISKNSQNSMRSRFEGTQLKR